MYLRNETLGVAMFGEYFLSLVDSKADLHTKNVSLDMHQSHHSCLKKKRRQYGASGQRGHTGTLARGTMIEAANSASITYGQPVKWMQIQ